MSVLRVLGMRTLSFATSHRDEHYARQDHSSQDTREHAVSRADKRPVSSRLVCMFLHVYYGSPLWLECIFGFPLFFQSFMQL